MREIPQKDVIVKIIEIYFPDAKIYLFGSHARGTNKQGSDVDIAIDAGRRLTLKEILNPGRLLDALNMERIDLVDFHRVPEGMKKAILEEGIVWKK